MPLTVIVAAVAAGAILLIALGVATSGSGSGISTRLERYASGKQESQKVVTGQGAIADLLAQSVALANLNKVVEQRDFGANLALELARAVLRLKVSEYLAIWAGTTIGVPGAMILLSVVVPTLGNPVVVLIGALIGFFIPRIWLGRRKSG